GLSSVLLVEKEAALCQRASLNNQARVHNGYHYPRSYTTAYRSRVNLPNFLRDWQSAVVRNFTALYAVARRNSRVNAMQFERFCREIGANLRPADSSLRALFEERLIEDVFVAEEYAFDANMLARHADTALKEAGVEVRCGTQALEVGIGSRDGLQIALSASQGELATVDT